MIEILEKKCMKTIVGRSVGLSVVIKYFNQRIHNKTKRISRILESQMRRLMMSPNELQTKKNILNGNKTPPEKKILSTCCCVRSCGTKTIKIWFFCFEFLVCFLFFKRKKKFSNTNRFASCNFFFRILGRQFLYFFLYTNHLMEKFYPVSEWNCCCCC